LIVSAVDPRPVSSLFIHWSEVHAFERRFATPAEKPTTQRAVNSALATVAVLARILATIAPEDVQKKILAQTPENKKKSGPLGTTVKPNANAIAELVRNHLTRTEIEAVGQSNSAVRDRIADGLKLLHSTSASNADCQQRK
jgi:hypothetical protein